MSEFHIYRDSRNGLETIADSFEYAYKILKAKCARAAIAVPMREDIIQVEETNQVKKVGIVADKYKVKRFEKELRREGFENYLISEFSDSAVTISIYVEVSKINEIKKLCTKVEMYFKRSN